MSKYPTWSAFVNWVTAHAFRWNRLVYAGLLFLVFQMILEKLGAKISVPSEVFWVTIGFVVSGFVNAMNAPDPSKSEVLTLAEKIIERDADVLTAAPYEPDAKD